MGVPLGNHTYYAPSGCAACNQKGYAGRKGVYEILLVDERMRQLISERVSPDRIQQEAVERGMTTLIVNGVRLAQAGETSLEEVLRILPSEQQRA